MAKRILLTGIVGGLVLFFWGFMWHEVLGLGLMGIRDIPNEQAMLTAMKANMPESGFYIFPAMNVPQGGTSAQKKAAADAVEKKATTGPAGFMIYQSVGKALSGGLLLTEFGTNVLQALIVAFLLAQTGLKRYSSRLGFATAMGLLAAITTNVSYWNWYGFGGVYTIGYISYVFLGYLFLGIVAAAIVKASVIQPIAVAAAAK